MRWRQIKHEYLVIAVKCLSQSRYHCVLDIKGDFHISLFLVGLNCYLSEVSVCV